VVLPVTFWVTDPAENVNWVRGLGSPQRSLPPWLYVALRVVHSAIQCTYNKVMHRMRAFIASVFVLWAIWALIAWDLVVLGRG